MGCIRRYCPKLHFLVKFCVHQLCWNRMIPLVLISPPKSHLYVYWYLEQPINSSRWEKLHPGYSWQNMCQDASGTCAKVEEKKRKIMRCLSSDLLNQSSNLLRGFQLIVKLFLKDVTHEICLPEGAAGKFSTRANSFSISFSLIIPTSWFIKVKQESAAVRGAAAPLS